VTTAPLGAAAGDGIDDGRVLSTWVVGDVSASTVLVAGVLAAVLGIGTAVVVWRAMRRGVLDHPSLLRTNHRGAEIVVGSGLVVIVASVVGTAVQRVMVAALGADAGAVSSGASWLMAAATTFGMLGFVDDVLGDAGPKGLRGHLGALRNGTLTTGAVKLFGGACAGLALAPGSPIVASLAGGVPEVIAPGPIAVVETVRAGAVIALSANLANLFDRAPGRTIKVGLLGGAAVLVAVPTALVVPLCFVLGAMTVLLVVDLREQAMLGDTGANAIGAVIGVVAVATLDDVGEWTVLVVSFAATLLSERVSFGRVIDSVAPLRWLDRLGRRT
jgi:UDP-N-acetylmuramyl pentapeptide phosphotransferase/UDP-N-acetylglucosamine-1-phosphate transferase